MNAPNPFEIDSTILENLSDDERVLVRSQVEDAGSGSLIVKLRVPVKLSGEQHERLVLRPITMRDVRAARGLANDDADAVLLAFADEIATPAGIVDQIASAIDGTSLLVAVEHLLGKYQAAGLR